ncbi:MAG: hypothetical protein HC811_05110 [Flammeovirgaceae bacterium]|nr:hypothetical protein [Flammeovirgaceae bacterium]
MAVEFFNLIDGPQGLPELQEFFITEQKLTAASLTSEFGIEYLKLDSQAKTKNLLKDLFEKDDKPKLLELETNTRSNREEYIRFKEEIKKGYNNI